MLYDRPAGDASAGFPEGYRIQTFSQLIENTADACIEPFTKPITICSAVSTDNRPRFWHVTFSGRDIVRQVTGAAVPPVGFQGGEWNYQPNRFPRSEMGLSQPTIMQAQIDIHDRTGGRSLVFDIVGKRSFDVYARSVQCNLLIPENGYQVRGSDAKQISNDDAFDGLVVDSVVGARIVPVVTNTSQIFDNWSITFNAGVGPTDIYVPIGAKFVQALVTPLAAAGGLTMSFTARSTTTLDIPVPWVSDYGAFPFDATTGLTERVPVPNFGMLRFTNTSGSAVCLTVMAEVEA
jgi:hypothetical protein